MKTILRLVRELRSAKREGFVVDFEVETEPKIRAVWGVGDIDIFAGEPVGRSQEQSYLKVMFNSTVSLETAERLKLHLLKHFQGIEKIVVLSTTHTSCAEMRIYTKKADPLHKAMATPL